MKKITILIPCYNEEGNLPRLHQALCEFTKSTFVITGKEGSPAEMDMGAFNWEFLFVNDGSTDGSLDIMKEFREKDPRVAILNLSRNFGKENAMLAGMDHFTGDALVVVDADLQDPLEVIPEMIYWWLQGYDDIYGERIGRAKESRIRKNLSLSFYRLLDRLTKIETLPNVGDFRLLDRRAVKALSEMRETQRYTKGLFCWVGFRKKRILYSKNDRLAGKSHFNTLRLVNLAIDGITSYTTSPLRIATVAGILISFAAFCYLIFICLKTWIWGEVVSGFPTLMCVILFLGGMQLLALGIIGEYVGRIFNEVKRRPPYIVESFNVNRNDEKPE